MAKIKGQPFDNNIIQPYAPTSIMVMTKLKYFTKR